MNRSERKRKSRRFHKQKSSKAVRSKDELSNGANYKKCYSK